MSDSNLLVILKELEQGLIDSKEAARKLEGYTFVDVDDVALDLGRTRRSGTPEVVYSQTKTADQLSAISNAYLEKNTDVLFSRLGSDQLPSVEDVLINGRYNPVAKTFLWRASSSKLPVRHEDAVPLSELKEVVIASAGSSDLFVVEEIVEALFFMTGAFPKIVSDCGVAGIHRILAHSETLKNARIVVTVAGMDGALPTVVAGMTKAPVIAVPTSVGYGPLGHGIAPLISMLTSCAPGLVVVNVDNGIGAAFAVKRMLSLTKQGT